MDLSENNKIWYQVITVYENYRCWKKTCPGGNYMFKFNNRNIRTREICSKLTIKKPERHQWNLECIWNTPKCVSFQTYSLVPNCKGVIFNFLENFTIYLKNSCKASNRPPLIKATPFCAYDLTGRYNSVFFKLTPLPLTPVDYS